LPGGADLRARRHCNLREIHCKRQKQIENARRMPRKPKTTGLYTDGTAPKAPSGLDRAGRKLWDAILGEYDITDEASLEILRSACECADRAEAAKREVARDGMTVESKTGSLRPHPALAVEATFRGLMLRHLNALAVNTEPKHDGPGRPARKTISPFLT
jgi:phage terminase small subunit